MGCVKIYSAVIFASCFLGTYSNFAPIGEEVEAGNVLLPATRRGRYLADIIRRQAVDGTGIKFNKDADRLNAEAKKQIDALSDELLTYVTSEQERRMTLHKRIMQAVQTGEHGVTVAEVRGRPPLFIQRGKYLRCPANRPALEPDNSGNVMCAEGAKPSQVLYDACLRSEDAPLYVVNGSTYFFCNRNRDKKSPELPRNETHVYNCNPRESTSRDYTVKKCTPEEAGDVIVHYRYYPDRLFTAVRELDPDGEVCENWNPCQIGYIFSIASEESARPAADLKWDEYPNDEFVKQNEGANGTEATTDDALDEVGGAPNMDENKNAAADETDKKSETGDDKQDSKDKPPPGGDEDATAGNANPTEPSVEADPPAGEAAVSPEQPEEATSPSEP